MHNRRIGDFSVFTGVGGVGVEPIDRLPLRLEIAEKVIVAESHPHHAGGIGNRRIDDAAGADESGEVRLGIFWEHAFTHTGTQRVRRDEDTGVIRGAVVQPQPDAVWRCSRIGHLRIEPCLDACRAGFGEKDFNEPRPADGDARRPELGFVVQLNVCLWHS